MDELDQSLFSLRAAKASLVFRINSPKKHCITLYEVQYTIVAKRVKWTGDPRRRPKLREIIDQRRRACKSDVPALRQAAAATVTKLPGLQSAVKLASRLRAQ